MKNNKQYPAHEWDPAIVELYTQEFDGLVRLARRLLDSRTLAEEAVQESFVKCHRAAIKPAEGKELAYLRSVVLNTARSMLRHRRVVEAWRPEAPLAEPSTESEWLQSVHHRAVHEALTHLPSRQRQVLVCRHIVGLSERETADALSISVGSVKTHSSRARHSLRTGTLAELVA